MRSSCLARPITQSRGNVNALRRLGWRDGRLPRQPMGHVTTSPFPSIVPGGSKWWLFNQNQAVPLCPSQALTSRNQPRVHLNPTPDLELLWCRSQGFLSTPPESSSFRSHAPEFPSGRQPARLEGMGRPVMEDHLSGVISQVGPWPFPALLPGRDLTKARFDAPCQWERSEKHLFPHFLE